VSAVLSWLLFGLLAGAVARLVVPGKTRIGFLGTVAVGMVGALIGGLIGDIVLGEENERFQWDLEPFLLAVVGSVAFLLVLEAVSRRRRRLW
jgi:uncharacterized membrane protein YeaQ/YmgE (transglycosylase-associated protein family)